MKFKILMTTAIFSAIFSLNCFATLPEDVLGRYSTLIKNAKFKEAIEVMLPYAKQGDDDAELKVRYAYIEGLKNYREGMKWYQSSSVKANPVAKTNLANIYYKIFDYKQALRLYEQADKMHYANATFMLGVMYYDERDDIKIGKDYEKAVRYFKKASDLGHADASYMLGICYMNAHGVAKDITLAKNFLRYAAKNGSKRAEEKLKSLGLK